MKQINIALLMAIILCFSSCEERDNFDDSLDSSLNIITELKGNDTQATIDDLQGIINLVLPPNSDASNVMLEIEAPQGIDISPASGSVLDLTESVEVIASSANGNRVYQLFTRVLPNEIAFLGEAATFNDLIATADDDVVAAAEWLQMTYPDDFVYLNAATVTIDDLESVNVVMFFYDQVGTSDLPTLFTEGTAKSTFIEYLVGGGKLLLGGMATSYAETIGRDQSGLLLIKGSGAGFDSPDTWTVDGGVNFVTSQLNHPIYTFNEGQISFDGNGFMPIINAGFREDHNNLWDIAPLLNPGHELGQFNEFERLYGGKVLGVWGGVGDECCPGIIEFMPQSPYNGTIIAIGIGGMEWNMNDGRDNPFLENVKAVYKNSIDYLSTL